MKAASLFQRNLVSMILDANLNLIMRISAKKYHPYSVSQSIHALLHIGARDAALRSLLLVQSRHTLANKALRRRL